MEIDRRAFLASLGGAAVIETMSSEALADALEHHMMDSLDAAVGIAALLWIVAGLLRRRTYNTEPTESTEVRT